MKAKVVFFTLVVGLGVASMAMSQDNQKENKDTDKVTVRIRMSEEKDGKTETIEKTYTYNNLSDSEREEKIKAIVDSLKGTNKEATNRRLSVTIEEGDAPMRERMKKEQRVVIIPKDGKKREEVRVFKYGPGDSRVETWKGGKRHYEFNFDEKAFADRMKRMEKELAPKMKKLEKNMEEWGRDFEPKFREFWHGDINMGGNNKPATVRGLEAFPNNPERDELNVRFYAPNKGDVTITITDVKGKQVSKKEVKDFSGDYVGQLSLGKNPKGTYFISVVQNEDGAVKRIVVE
ncbi:MAG: T9SS type A sorting domain-containing protein [Spirosomataceae bacterium]